MPDLLRPSLRFLLVEDETVDAIDLECLLEDLGHRVTAVAFGARSAEKILARDGDEIDAAILGMSYPGRGVLSIAKSLRARGVPLAVASDQSLETIRSFGFIEPYLEKPLNPATLVGTIEGFRNQRLRVAC